MLVKGVRGDYNGLRVEVSKVVRVSGEKMVGAEQKGGAGEAKWLSGEQKSGVAAQKLTVGEQKSGAMGGKMAEVEQENGVARVNGGDLVDKLRADWPELRFRVGKKFAFRPPRTVVYEAADFEVSSGGDEGVGVADCRAVSGDAGARSEAADAGGVAGEMAGVDDEKVGVDRDMAGVDFEQNWYNLQLLHEVGHALLGHCEYGADLERLKMERAAWEKARELCGRHGVEYDEAAVEGALDTYRDWLHRRSRCAKCGLTRFQGADGRYRCPGCDFDE